jgi:hypothetical protein
MHSHLWLMSSDTRLFILGSWGIVSLPISQPKGRFYDIPKSIREMAGMMGAALVIVMPEF